MIINTSATKTFNFDDPTGIMGDIFAIAGMGALTLALLTISYPQNVMTVVTGVAGSGKSTLINKVLPKFYPETTIIDQSLFSTGMRSNLLTYLGLSDAIRKMFATANHVSDKLFSRNSLGGCERIPKNS